MVIKLKKLALDMIPVILGVLIGLLINDWKEGFDEKKYLQKALDAIEQDIVSSKNSLVGVLDSQQVLMDSLQFYAENDTVTLLDVFYKAKGLKAPIMKDIAIEFFTSDRGDLIDYQFISIMAEMKDFKVIVNEKFDRLTAYVNEEMYGTTYQVKEKTLILLADIIGSEKDLIEIYDTYLAQSGNTEDTETTKETKSTQNN